MKQVLDEHKQCIALYQRENSQGTTTPQPVLRTVRNGTWSRIRVVQYRARNGAKGTKQMQLTLALHTPEAHDIATQHTTLGGFVWFTYSIYILLLVKGLCDQTDQ